MKLSADGRSGGPGEYADGVAAWPEEDGLRDRIDACRVGEGRLHMAYQVA